MLLSGEAVHLDKGNTHVKLDEESVRRLGKDPTEVDVLAGFNTSQARYVEDGDRPEGSMQRCSPVLSGHSC